jgi:hypothetical protein
MTTTDIKRLVAERPVAALQAAANIAIREAGVTVEWNDAAPAVAWNGSTERRVRAPRPRTVSNLASLLHEIAHQRLHRGQTAEAIGWLGELEASQWALAWWDQLGLPDRDQAAFGLGEALSGYLRAAIENGTNMAAIDERVPQELLPYRGRLEALERRVNVERRRARGEDVEAMSEIPVW